MIYTGPLPPHLARAASALEAEEPAPDAPPRRRLTAPLGFTALASLAAGVAIGVLATSWVRDARPSEARAAAVVPAPADTIAALPAAIPSAPPPAEPAVEARPAQAAVARPASSAPEVAQGPRSADPARCPLGPSRADYDVCIDPQIRAADRDLHAAYRRAIDIGAPVDTLRPSEIDWLLAREAAAKRSGATLMKAYRERIAQLDALTPPDAAPH